MCIYCLYPLISVYGQQTMPSIFIKNKNIYTGLNLIFFMYQNIRLILRSYFKKAEPVKCIPHVVYIYLWPRAVSQSLPLILPHCTWGIHFFAKIFIPLHTVHFWLKCTWIQNQYPKNGVWSGVCVLTAVVAKVISNDWHTAWCSGCYIQCTVFEASIV